MRSSPDLTVTRFAPSPTGHLHIGGARTALFCWAFARRTGGRFLIRVEDTDRARSSEASARGILEDLAWLGIEWDEGPELRVGGTALQGCGEGHTSETCATGTIGGDPRKVGPFFQSQRLAIYDAVIGRMIERGTAYQAFEKPDELESKRKAASAAKQQYRYDRAALAIPAAERAARVRAGEPHVVRFKCPDEPIRVVDEVLGEVSFAAGEIDDFVLRKADGFPTYHFGVVVDDEAMGVTHVLRGQEHLNNTPRHVALQKALEYRTPVYAHMPLIFNEAGAKMSKRERDQTAREAVKAAGLKASPTGSIDEATFSGWLGDKKRQLETEQLEALAGAMHLRLPEVSVDDFRRAGYLPEVICNFIALLGWSPGGDREKFDMRYLAEKFELSKIGKTNARFDRKKLLSFNSDAMAAMIPAEFASRWIGWCGAHAPEVSVLPEDKRAALARMLQARSKTFRDAADRAGFALIGDGQVVYPPEEVKKQLLGGHPSGLEVLRRAREALAAVEPWEPRAIHAALQAMAGADSLGKIAQPIRFAVTGGSVSPPIDETLALVGKVGVLRRIDRVRQAAGG